MVTLGVLGEYSFVHMHSVVKIALKNIPLPTSLKLSLDLQTHLHVETGACYGVSPSN